MAETGAEVAVRRYVARKHVYVAELCRPRTMNSFTDAVYQQLIAAIREYEANDELHALVITGHGDYFTSGADISTFMHVATGESDALPSKGWARLYMNAMVQCPKVLVAAVNGPAVGIGVTLLLHCDFVYATPTATFWTPFMRVGIVPEFAASYLFPLVLGPQLANDMLMRSRRIGIDRAVARGLVGSVLPVDNFMANVLDDLEPMVADIATAKNLPTYKAMLHRPIDRDAAVREAIYREYCEIDKRFISGESQAAVRETLAALQKNKNKNKSKGKSKSKSKL